MSKSKKPASTFETIVEVKYGKGKKAVVVQVPVTLKFGDIPTWCIIEDAPFHVMPVINEKVINKKELKAAYKGWLATSDED